MCGTSSEGANQKCRASRTNHGEEDGFLTESLQQNVQVGFLSIILLDAIFSLFCLFVAFVLSHRKICDLLCVRRPRSRKQKIGTDL